MATLHCTLLAVADNVLYVLVQSLMDMEQEETGKRPPLITFSHFLPLQVI